jgi:hypothetical protein
MFERGEAFECLEPLAVVVGIDKVPKMLAKFIMGAIMVPFDGGFF